MHLELLEADAGQDAGDRRADAALQNDAGGAERQCRGAEPLSLICALAKGPRLDIDARLGRCAEAGGC